MMKCLLFQRSNIDVSILILIRIHLPSLIQLGQFLQLDSIVEFESVIAPMLLLLCHRQWQLIELNLVKQFLPLCFIEISIIVCNRSLLWIVFGK